VRQDYLTKVRCWCHAASDQDDEMVCEMLLGLALDRTPEEAEAWMMAANYLADNMTPKLLEDFYNRVAWRFSWKSRLTGIDDWKPGTIIAWGVPVTMAVKEWMTAWAEALTHAYLSIAWNACERMLPPTGSNTLDALVNITPKHAIEQAERRCKLMIRDRLFAASINSQKLKRARGHFNELLTRLPASYTSDININDYLLWSAAYVALWSGVQLLRDPRRHITKVVEDEV